jgi:hypothetical protein
MQGENALLCERIRKMVEDLWKHRLAAAVSKEPRMSHAFRHSCRVVYHNFVFVRDFLLQRGCAMQRWHVSPQRHPRFFEGPGIDDDR